MGIMVWIVPGLVSGMFAKSPPGWLAAIVGAAILLAAYCLSGGRTVHAAAAGVGPTELGMLA